MDGYLSEVRASLKCVKEGRACWNAVEYLSLGDASATCERPRIDCNGELTRKSKHDLASDSRVNEHIMKTLAYIGSLTEAIGNILQSFAVGKHFHVRIIV